MAKKKMIGKNGGFEIITHGTELTPKETNELELSWFIVSVLMGAGVALNQEEALNTTWDYVRGGLKKDAGDELGRIIANLQPGAKELQ